MLKGFFARRAAAQAARGEYDAAIRGYTKAGDRAGVADVLVMAGRTAEAIALYEELGLPDKAAEAAKAGKDYQRAAELRLKAGDPKGAVAVLREGRDLQGAIRVCLDNGLRQEAAELYEATGRRREAARMWAETGNHDRAIELYREAGDGERLVAAYVARGNLDAAVDECLARGELAIAARLAEAGGDPGRAARLNAEAGNLDRAAALYEQSGDHHNLALLLEKSGQLDLAAAAYEQVPGRETDAAVLYSKLVVLEAVQEWTFESVVLCGAFASDADAAVLGLANRNVLYTNRALETRWQFRLSGEITPCSIALSPDGSLIAVGTDAPVGSSGFQLIVLNQDKQIAFQHPFSEAVRQVAFLRDGSGVLATTGDSVLMFGTDGVQRWESKVDFRAWALDLSPDSTRIAVGSLGGVVRILNLAGKEIGGRDCGDRIHRVRFNAEGDRLVALAGNSRLVFASGDLSSADTVEHREALRTLEVHPGREFVILAGVSNLSLMNWDATYLSRQPLPVEVTALFGDPFAMQPMIATRDCKVTAYRPQDFRQKSAEMYVRAGHLAEAARIFEEIGVYDKAYDLYRQLGEYENAARVVQSTGDEVKAARHYEVVGRFVEAARLYENSGELALAARCYGKANELLRAAQIYEQLNDLILAADYYEQAGEHKRAAFLFKKATQTERAMSNFEAWVAAHPDDREGVFELGALYAANGRQDEAIRLLQQLTDAEDFRREALRLLGESFVAKGLHDVGIDRFNEAIGENRKPSRENIDLYYNIGVAHEKANRFAEATDVFSKVMAIDYYYRDIQERLAQSQQMSVVMNKPTAGELKEFETDSLFATSPAVAPKVTGGYERYRILKKLGQGGMGVVYLASDERLGRQVAWKVLPSHLTADKEFQARLLREARAVAQLNNKHVVGIYDIVTDDNECYITMEYIDGTTLRHKMRAAPQLPVLDASRHGMEIAEALGVAHQAGVIHRDVKPENIMLVQATGDVKMVDFGLARLGEDNNLTREGVIAGTLAYMAPEQIRAEAMDYRVDIYALGIVLFEMVVGKQPFVGENILGQHLSAEVPDIASFRNDVPPEYVQLTLACLAKDPGERPANCELIQARLREINQAAAAFQTTIYKQGGSA